MVKSGDLLDGKYHVGHRIGSGGMGTVYFGEDVRLGRAVAIKVLRHELSQREVAVERFRREARAGAQIASPHVAEVIDVGEHSDGSSYIVLEYLEGESLEARLERRGTLPAETAVRVALEALEGLEAAHARGVVHRDLKPDNLYFARTASHEVVKILDFGVSKTRDAATHLTQADTVVGTPAYMSPEQARGRDDDVDQRSDVYSLGVVLYQMLCGQLPFQGENATDLLFNIVLEQPTPLETYAPDVDPELSAIIRRATSRSLTERYASARELREALENWLWQQSASIPALAITMRAPRPSLPPAPLASARRTPGRGLFAMAAAAAVLVLAGWTQAKRIERAEEADAHPSTVAASMVTTPPSTPAAAPEAARAPTPPTASVRAPFSMRVVTRPAGAAVHLASDGRKLCAATPCDIKLDAGKTGEIRTLALFGKGSRRVYQSFHVGDREVFVDFARPAGASPAAAASAETEIAYRKSPY